MLVGNRQWTNDKKHVTNCFRILELISNCFCFYLNMITHTNIVLSDLDFDVKLCLIKKVTLNPVHILTIVIVNKKNVQKTLLHQIITSFILTKLNEIKRFRPLPEIYFELFFTTCIWHTNGAIVHWHTIKKCLTYQWLQQIEQWKMYEKSSSQLLTQWMK